MPRHRWKMVLLTAVALMAPSVGRAATYHLPMKSMFSGAEAYSGLDSRCRRGSVALSCGVHVYGHVEEAGTAGEVCVWIDAWVNNRWEEERGCGTAVTEIDDLLASARLVATVPSKHYIGTLGDSTQRPSGLQGTMTIDLSAVAKGGYYQGVLRFCGLSPCIGWSAIERQAVANGQVFAGVLGVHFTLNQSWAGLYGGAYRQMRFWPES